MNQLIVVFMDAGQGDCTLVVYPDDSLMMVDCGSIKNGDVVTKTIQGVLKNYLPANGNKIDNLVLTHPDQDHYNMLKNFFINPAIYGVDQVYYGGDLLNYKNARENNATYNWLKNKANTGPPPNTFGGHSPDPLLSRAGVDVYVLAANASGNPKGKTSHLSNTNSIVLMIEYNGVKVFLMGDATWETEEFILTSCKVNKLKALLTNTKMTALKLGHHGSDTSSTPEWVSAITPNALFVSSDTREFGSTGKGMPTSTLLNSVIANSDLMSVGKKLSHNYIVWDYDHPKSNYYKKPMQVGPTEDAICTTLCSIKYDKNYYEFQSAGSFWYFYVDKKGVPSFWWPGC